MLGAFHEVKAVDWAILQATRRASTHRESPQATRCQHTVAARAAHDEDRHLGDARYLDSAATTRSIQKYSAGAYRQTKGHQADWGIELGSADQRSRYRADDDSVAQSRHPRTQA